MQPRFHIERVPKSPEGAIEHVKLEVEFEWRYIGKFKVDVAERTITLPEVREAGVYRIRSGVRDEAGSESDAVYVGMAAKDIDRRVCIHVRDDGKAFAENLAKDQGWAELEIAINPAIDGVPDLNLADPRVLHLIEAVGIAESLGFHNTQNKK